MTVVRSFDAKNDVTVDFIHSRLTEIWLALIKIKLNFNVTEEEKNSLALETAGDKRQIYHYEVIKFGCADTCQLPIVRERKTHSEKSVRLWFFFLTLSISICLIDWKLIDTHRARSNIDTKIRSTCIDTCVRRWQMIQSNVWFRHRFQRNHL